MQERSLVVTEIQDLPFAIPNLYALLLRCRGARIRLALLMAFDQLMLQADSTAEAIEMLPKSIEAVDCVLISLARAPSQLRSIANFAWPSEQPFRLRLHQTLLEESEGRLMISHGVLNPI